MNGITLAAKVISRVTEPIVWTPLMIWLVLQHVRVPYEKQLVFYPLLLLFVFVVPFGYLMYKVKIKKEFDIDVTQRSKRVPFILRTMFSFAAAVVLTFFIERELFIITTAVFLSTLGLVLVTLYWKISFHGGLNTLIFSTVNYIYNWQFWWLFLLLIPIAWSRLVLQKHTPAQLAAGIVLTAVVFFTITGFSS